MLLFSCLFGVGQPVHWKNIGYFSMLDKFDFLLLTQKSGLLLKQTGFCFPSFITTQKQ